MPHKAIRICVLLLLCVLFLSGCHESTFTVFLGSSESRDISATVNTSTKTITVDGDIYEYEKRAEYTSIVWPDGVTYIQEKQGNSWVGNVSGTIDAETYLSKDEALRILDKIPEDKGVGWFSVLMILLGYIYLANKSRKRECLKTMFTM